MIYQLISTFEIRETSYLWKEWEPFLCKQIKTANLGISISEQINMVYGLDIIENQPGKPVLKANNSLLCVNPHWTEAKITSFDGNKGDIYKLLNALIMTHLSAYQTIEAHASLIDVGGKGLMYLGPSGIGKTTQAELWGKYRNATIINGDMVFIKKEGNRFYGCGSPWHGSSSYCLNRKVPLYALIVLKQSKENSIRRLTGFEMVSEVMNSVFFPTWYEKGHEAVCKILDTLLQSLPIYELSCYPDENSVKFTEEAIFGR